MALVIVIAAMDICLGIGGFAWNSSWMALTTVAIDEVYAFHPWMAGPLYSIVTGSSDG